MSPEDINLKKLRMKLQKIVYYASGENSGTYSAKCFLENFTGDLNEKTERFVSWDCNIPTEVDMFRVREVQLPDWMSENEFMEWEIDYKYAIGLAGECVIEMSREKFMNFKDLSEKKKYWYGWAKKSKNAFITSLFNQFDQWLEDPKFKSPLSEKQWEYATRYCPLYEAKAISKSLYYQR